MRGLEARAVEARAINVRAVEAGVEVVSYCCWSGRAPLGGDPLDTAAARPSGGGLALPQLIHDEVVILLGELNSALADRCLLLRRRTLSWQLCGLHLEAHMQQLLDRHNHMRRVVSVPARRSIWIVVIGRARISVRVIGEGDW